MSKIFVGQKNPKEFEAGIVKKRVSAPVVNEEKVKEPVLQEETKETAAPVVNEESAGARETKAKAAPKRGKKTK
jgi:hypothetical protein